MKLRIKGNSIRLRLSQSEVDQIGRGEAVNEQVSFGNNSSGFSYSLQPQAEQTEIFAQYADNKLLIMLPEKKAQLWASSDIVGMENDISFENGDTLYILIEKDFQCLHQRPREDEQDNFPNPAAQT
ncbi:hypothetical protein PZB74_03350 [Porifericola rhodea]|uniref:DUF7009 family protein n=1 Tax=Porifericola rhodea TaxID=930972 RepID=UPI0026655197|nr:hypothetical protein [Porifericola rhodea]WKN32385.1 hypothetical protein PZB74_03350 [Porifericola rhodea]